MGYINGKKLYNINVIKENGATFTPSVSEDGVISWTNNKGLENPPPVNIKGAKGEGYTLTEDDKTDIADMVNADMTARLNTIAAARNSFFRGAYLGDTVTAEQWQAIQDGTFDDLWVGDYWEINGVKWRIAAFDYFYRDYYTASDNDAAANHHITIVPDTCPDAQYHPMKADGDISGGYVFSDCKTSLLGTTLAKITTAFGEEHIMRYSAAMCNGVTDGKPSAVTHTTTSVDLLSEVMLFGRHTVGTAGATNGHYYAGTSGYTQMPLFALAPDFIQGIDIYREQNLLGYWLRDIAGNSHFACVTTSSGLTGATGASNLYGAYRPVFNIYNKKLGG